MGIVHSRSSVEKLLPCMQHHIRGCQQLAGASVARPRRAAVLFEQLMQSLGIALHARERVGGAVGCQRRIQSQMIEYNNRVRSRTAARAAWR